MAMNKINLALILILFGLVITLFYKQYQTQEKIAFIRSSILLSQYEGMQQAMALYKQKTALWEANIDTLRSEMNRSVQAYQTDLNKMTEKEKALNEELLETKRKQLIDYSKNVEQKAKEEDAALTKEVYEKINLYLQEYGQENGYKIIFAANETGNIVYGKDAIDLTEEILEGMNLEYKQ